MGMKHILRALDQALETAEVERKYLRDELEAERVEKQRLAAEMDELRRQGEEQRVSFERTQGGAGQADSNLPGAGEDLGRGAGGHGRETAGAAQGQGAPEAHGGQPGA